VASAWGYLAATTNRHQPGEHVSVLIRPEAGRLYSARSAEPAPPVTINILHGKLTSRSFRGGRYRVNVQPETGPALTFELTVVNSFSLSPGDPVTLTLDPAGVVVLPLR